jgi:hypothetical protein
MPTTGRRRTRWALLVAAMGLALVLPVTLSVWSATRTVASSRALPPSASSPPGGAAQLRGLAPATLDRQVAAEEAAAVPGASRAAPAKGSRIAGQVGTYQVGRGVAAGTYASAAPGGGRTCRWAVSGTSGNTLRSGHGTASTVVTIHATDGFFETNGCSSWRRVS